eukprot:9469651-Pyramimonas_sp.AAC.2
MPPASLAQIRFRVAGEKETDGGESTPPGGESTPPGGESTSTAVRHELDDFDRAVITALEGVTLSQRTPHRVETRRADLVRERKILRISDVKFCGDEAEASRSPSPPPVTVRVPLIAASRPPAVGSKTAMKGTGY